MKELPFRLPENYPTRVRIMTKKRFDYCILDSAPLLTGTISPDLSDHFYTVPAVFDEIKDEASRQRLANLPFRLVTKNPSPEAVALVHRFARSTGDITVLSATDLQVVALAVTVELEQNGLASKIRRFPEELPKSTVHDGTGSVVVTQSHKKNARQPRKKTGAIEVSDFSDHENDTKADAAKLAKELAEKAKLEEEKEAEDSEGEWITPENIKSVTGEGKKKKKKNKKKKQPESTESNEVESKEKIESVESKEPKPELKKIACVTADFAMQNVLLKIRCQLYTTDGVRIKTIKNFLLRCHACYTTTLNMDARFCPKCGGPTLMRCSYLLDESGRIHVFLRGDYQFNLRGTKYSIPTPTGGRQGAELILREDQKEYVKQREHYQRIQNKLQKAEAVDFEEALDDRIAAVFGAAGSAGAGKNRRYDQYDGFSLPVVGHGRKNPNVSRKKV